MMTFYPSIQFKFLILILLIEMTKLEILFAMLQSSA